MRISPVASQPHKIIETDMATALVAIGWKCLDCTGGSRHEVAICQIEDCALHHLRMRGLKNRGRAQVEGKVHKGNQNFQNATTDTLSGQGGEE